LPKARSVLSEGATSCMAIRRVWSFSPSLTPEKSLSEDSTFRQFSNRIAGSTLAGFSVRSHYMILLSSVIAVE
jgi:hypothetical protein